MDSNSINSIKSFLWRTLKRMVVSYLMIVLGLAASLCCLVFWVVRSPVEDGVKLWKNRRQLLKAIRETCVYVRFVNGKSWDNIFAEREQNRNTVKFIEREQKEMTGIEFDCQLQREYEAKVSKRMGVS